MRRSLHLLAPVALGLPSLAFAGSVLKLEMKDYAGDPPVVSTIEISTEGRSSRMEMTTAGQEESSGMIWRGESADMVAIDHQAREYFVLDEAAMETMAERVGGAMREMQKALEAMPPEQRAMAEAMMKEHMPGLDGSATPPATLHATGRKDSVGGFGCRYYEVRRANVKVRELCVTPWDDLPDGRSTGVAMLEMAGFFDRIANAFSDGAGLDLTGGQHEIWEHMRELDGYPVLTRELDESGAVTSETVLRAAESKRLDTGFFEPPEGYAARQLEF